MNRRQFLRTAFGASLALAFPRTLISQAAQEAGAKVREFRFSASKTRVNLGTGGDFWAFTYNGRVPGPEIRVKEGEIVRVHLKNYLPDETTIHWHGVPVSNAMDGVPGVTQSGIAPGESFVYEFEARPAGTFFYHSHVKYQLDQGLYGPLIIEPGNPRRPYDREYTLMLEDWVAKDGGGTADTARRPAGMMGGMMGGPMGSFGAADPLTEPYYDAYAVNGKVFPAAAPLSVRKGERVKLRLISPSSASIYDLRLAGHALTVTHADANPVRPIDTDILRIGMGERYDVEFTADNPGYWLLAAMERGLGESGLRVPIRYKGDRSSRPVAPLFQSAMRFASYWDFEALHPSTDRSDPAAEGAFPQILSGGMHSSYWTINGQVYPDAEPLPVREGDRVRIGYLNRSVLPHPMHLHGHFFKVVNPRLNPGKWIKKDTIIVYPMERAEIEFRADNPGKWLHHCHNLYHLNAGMANVVAYRS